MEFSGLRPGEKLDERLVYLFEEALPTGHPLIKRLRGRSGVSRDGAGDHFEYCVHEVIGLAQEHGDAGAIVRALATCVPEYRPLIKLPLEKPFALVQTVIDFGTLSRNPTGTGAI